MNIYTLLMIIPVVLAVALIIMIVRRNITENSGRSIDIAPAIPAVVVLMIAVLVIAPMAESTQDYLYDEGSGVLDIQKNIAQLPTQPWDEYGDEVKTLNIHDSVDAIGTGAFRSLTALEYMSVPEGLSFPASSLGTAVYDVHGQALASIGGGLYAGLGTGLTLVDPAIFTYSSNGATITGLSDATVTRVVFPTEHDGVALTGVGSSAFQNSGLVSAVFFDSDELGKSQIITIGNSCFMGSASLVEANLPRSATSLGTSTFNTCAALSDLRLPDTLTRITYHFIYQCESLASLELPGSLTEIVDGAMSSSYLVSVSIPSKVTLIGSQALAGNTALEEVSIPSSVESVGVNAFYGCTGIRSVSFAPGFAATLGNNCFNSWTFYASDGTTTIDKTDASALAGKTFMGTAAALVEVSAGALSLTPDQIQQVNLHNQELQDLTEHVAIDPLPFQPSLQTQDQEQETA